MSKVIQVEVEARRRVKEGKAVLGRGVEVTLGPHGCPVIFGKTITATLPANSMIRSVDIVKLNDACSMVQQEKIPT